MSFYPLRENVLILNDNINVSYENNTASAVRD
jgi:hypothetical protein